jgi:hypothetical protein
MICLAQQRLETAPLHSGSFLNKAFLAQTRFYLPVDSSATARRQTLSQLLEPADLGTKGYFFDEKTTIVAKNQQETSRKRRNPTMKASRTQEVPQKFNK